MKYLVTASGRTGYTDDDASARYDTLDLAIAQAKTLAEITESYSDVCIWTLSHLVTVTAKVEPVSS